MSGLLRILLVCLVVAVASPLTMMTSSGAVHAQGGSSCTATKTTVACLFLRTESVSGTLTLTGQRMSGANWVTQTTISKVKQTIAGTYYIHMVFTGLAPDTEHTLRAQIVPYGGSNYYTVPATVRTPADIPDPPEQVSVSRNDAGDEATVDWTAPDGTLTKFVIQRAELQRTSGVAVWGKETFFETADGDTLTYTDTGLDPDVTYQYQVAAVNANGTGFYSATVRTLGAVGENDVAVDDRGYDAIPTPDHGQLPTGYDTSTGDAELVAAVDASITQMISPTGLTWDPDKMRHFLVVLGAGVLAGAALVGNRKLGNRINGQSILLAFLLFQAALWLGALMLGFPWHWAMLPTLMTVGLGLIAFGKKVTA